MGQQQQHHNKTLVVGLGVVGRSVCRFLRAQGTSVMANDAKDRRAIADADALEANGVELLLGAHPKSVPNGVARIVVSPGVPDLPVLEDARSRGIPIVGELALAAPHLRGLVIAITGTNGKSTVTSLVGEMCDSLGRPLFVGGNLGRPLLDAVATDAAEEQGVVVLELSSFQLERVGAFRPHIAAILNVSDDHLDRYDDFAHYVRTKVNLAINQKEEDRLVVPARADELAPILEHTEAQSVRAQLLRFGGSDGVVRVVDGRLQNGSSGLALETAAMRLSGEHNVDNACAAALIAREAGVDASAIEAVLRRYEGLPHRMKLVDTVAGVNYVNDSKATNVGAAVAAVKGAALDAGGRVVLIAGGRDKGGSYAPLAAAAKQKARAAVVLGEASERIAEALEQDVPVVRAASLEEAVRLAAQHALPGDMVLLAPACSSYDMFSSYVERGEHFADAVGRLAAATKERVGRKGSR